MKDPFADLPLNAVPAAADQPEDLLRYGPRSSSRTHKILRPEDLTVIVDTREPDPPPWNLAPLKSIRDTLVTGDYTIKGLNDHIVCERKTLGDLISVCSGESRERFEKELKRMLAIPARCVIVEATWTDLSAGNWYSKLHPNSAIGSVLGWIGWGIPFIFANDAKTAGLTASRFMFLAARRRFYELETFHGELRLSS